MPTLLSETCNPAVNRHIHKARLHTRADSSKLYTPLQGVHNSNFAPLQPWQQSFNKTQIAATAKRQRQRKTKPRPIAMKGHPCTLAQYTSTHTHTHTHAHLHTLGQQGNVRCAELPLALLAIAPAFASMTPRGPRYTHTRTINGMLCEKKRAHYAGRM